MITGDIVVLYYKSFTSKEGKETKITSAEFLHSWGPYRGTNHEGNVILLNSDHIVHSTIIYGPEYFLEVETYEKIAI